MDAEAELYRVRRVRRRKALQFAAWAMFSIIGGATAAWVSVGSENATRAFLSAAGVQFVIWGAINACFAIAGLMQAKRADATPVTAEAVAAELADRQKLLRTLQFNQKLNYLWLATGLVLLVWAVAAMIKGSADLTVASLFGHAAGVIIQGGFLTLFDRGFTRALAGVNIDG